MLGGQTLTGICWENKALILRGWAGVELTVLSLVRPHTHPGAGSCSFWILLLCTHNLMPISCHLSSQPCCPVPGGRLVTAGLPLRRLLLHQLKVTGTCLTPRLNTADLQVQDWTRLPPGGPCWRQVHTVSSLRRSMAAGSRGITACS